MTVREPGSGVRPRRHRWMPGIPLVLLLHPFELALGVVLLINSGRGIRGELSPSLDQLPTVPLWLYLVVSGLGGAGVLTGLLLTDRAGLDIDRARHGLALERGALFLVAASYAGLAVLIIDVAGKHGTSQAVLTGVIAAACLLRAAAIRRTVRTVLAAYTAQLRAESDGDVSA